MDHGTLLFKTCRAGSGERIFKLLESEQNRNSHIGQAVVIRFPSGGYDQT